MFGFIQNIGVPSLILILIVALVIFGPGKLPDVGKAMGQTIKSFKRAVNDEEDGAVKAEADKKED